MSNRTASIESGPAPLRLSIGVGIVLALLYAVMRLTDAMQWSVSDFALVGVLLFGGGLLWIMIARRLPTRTGRIVAAIGCVLAVLYLWAELAVGVFTSLGS